MESSANLRSVYLACPTIRGPGGIASYARRVIEALAPQPVDVLSHGPEEIRFDLPENARLIGTSHSQQAFSLRLLSDFARRPPTVFIFAHLGLAGPLGLLPRMSRHRTVAMLHGIEGWIPLRSRRAFGLKRVDDFVFTTRYTRELFLHWNRHHLRPEATAGVIPLSAEASLEESKPLPFPDNPRKRVLCVTRVTRGEGLKGLGTLLEAARLLPADEWEIRIVGEGDGRAAYEAQARALRVADRVHFLGWISDRERSHELAAADVLCLPSAQEGFGIVFLEAMVAGRPCVGAAAGAIPEVVLPEAGELFPYADPERLARAIRRASSRLRRGEVTPESIRAAYDEHYAWRLFASRWAGHLARLRVMG